MKTKTTQKTRKPQTADNESLKSIFQTKDQYPIPAVPIIAQSSLRQLQQLYGKQIEIKNEAAEQPIGTLPSKTMEAHILAAAKLKKDHVTSDLMDVSLDE